MTMRLLGEPAPGCPIAPLPVDDAEWAALTPVERRLLARHWFRVAQPMPLQRGWLPNHTRRSGRNLWLNTQFALRLWGGMQHGKKATADLVHDLDAARARAQTLTGEVDDTCNSILELSALVLADRAYSAATTKPLDVRTREAS